MRLFKSYISSLCQLVPLADPAGESGKE